MTLPNLNRMIASKPYSDNMMMTCLLRMVNHYESKQLEHLRGKNSNEIARFLLSLDSRLYRKAFHKSRLQQSCRNVHETLGSAVMKVKLIIDKLYELPAPVPAAQANPKAAGANQTAAQAVPIVGQVADREHDPDSIANRLIISTIISFIDDRLAGPLLTRVRQDNSAGRLLSYKEYLNLAMYAELRSNVYPNTVLMYGRNLSSNFPTVQLNSVEFPLVPR